MKEAVAGIERITMPPASLFTGFSIGREPLSITDLLSNEAASLALEAVWSDLRGMVTGTALGRRIAEIAVAENDHVEPGQLLFRIAPVSYRQAHTAIGGPVMLTRSWRPERALIEFGP